MMTMLLKLTWQHRDFCTMKAIYIWPALIGLLYLTGVGLSKAKEWKWLDTIIIVSFTMLMLASAYEIISIVSFLHDLNGISSQ